MTKRTKRTLGLKARRPEDLGTGSSTVAVVQAASVALDRKQTLEKALDLTRDASKRGARLVLFPESFLPGYPRGLDFGAVVGSRSEVGRDAFRRFWESAVDVPGPEVQRLAGAARSNRVYLVIGVVERDRGTLYCTVLFFSSNGALLGKHRKVMPTGSERLIWGLGDGSTLPVFDTALGRAGAVICWENYMPLLRTYMYSQGIEIYCAPTADHRETWVPTMQHIAVEGRCFVLGCNQFNRRRDFPEEFKSRFGEAPDTVISRGGSCIVDPFGKFLAGPDFQGETILVAELDRGQLPRAKFDLDAVGHYSRPDIFQLLVDDRPKPVLTRASIEAGREPQEAGHAGGLARIQKSRRGS
jgi:nitrilase